MCVMRQNIEMEKLFRQLTKRRITMGNFLPKKWKKNFLPSCDSPLSQLPEEFLHLDILPHLTQITPKRSLKIAIRSHAATQLVCAIAKYRNALGRFIQCTQQAEIRQKLYVQFLRSQTVCYNNGGFWGWLVISCLTMNIHACIASFLHCFAQCAIIQ